MFFKVKHIHFVGIGGVGMSGIAEVLLNLGFKISGSDIVSTDITKRLEKLGATVYIGHNKKYVEGVDVVVVSSAIPSNNPEVKRAKELSIPVIKRAEMLGELMRMKYSIAVAGSHGKTTTTSMIAHILAYANFDPTIVIGGKLKSLGSNAKLGNGKFLVAEADESDGSFLNLFPTISIVTNIDKEHLNHYKSMKNLKIAFLEFLNKVPFYGLSIINYDDKNLKTLIPMLNKRFITFSISKEDADLVAKDIKLSRDSSYFSIYFKKEKLGEIFLPVPGIHNIYNSLAALCVGKELGIDFNTIKSALREFSGVSRRFELKAIKKGIYFIDDYGHHPTEIEFTLKTARFWGKRVVVLFQPHRFTRTKLLLKEFSKSFFDADFVFVTDIYPAGERAIENVNAENLVREMKRSGYKYVKYVKKDQILDEVLKILEEGDVFITLGAGDIWKVQEEIISKI